MNALCMCAGCHEMRKDSWHQSPLAGAEWLKGAFPDMYEYADKHRWETKKWSLEELEKMLEDLNMSLEETPF